MPNQFEYADWLTMEGLEILANETFIGNYFDQSFSDEFDKQFPVGDTIRVWLPWRPQIRTGMGYTPQAIERRHTTITIQQPIGVDFEWDSAEEALKLSRGREKIRKEYLEPAMKKLAQQIDDQCANWATLNTPNLVGVLGTSPSSLDTTGGAARQLMKENACPDGDEKIMIVPPRAMRGIVNSAFTFFNPQNNLAKNYMTGKIIGDAEGFKWAESMSLFSTTASTWAGAVTLSAGPANGATSATVTCTTGDTFTAGDIITFGGSFPVNPMTQRRTQSANTKTYVLTQSTVGVANAATINFYPGMEGPGSNYQNIDALPSNGAALTLYPGTAGPNGLSGINGLALTKGAFALAGVPLANPKASSVEIASQNRDPDSGLSISFVRQFQADQRRYINRFDVMFGFGNLYPESCAVRVACA